jgi:hypothetical protein
MARVEEFARAFGFLVGPVDEEQARQRRYAGSRTVKQIPFGNDRKKSKSKGKCYSRTLMPRAFILR